MENNNKRNKILGIILIVAIIILIITLIVCGIEAFNSNKKDESESMVENNTVILSSGKTKPEGKEGSLSQLNTTSSSREKVYMEDYEVIGNLEIPKIELKTKILSETTKRSLEIAVAQIYTTGGLNQPGNTVIYGHNYRNTLFFSRNDELVVGDKFYITDMDNNKKTYQIYNIFETTSTDTSFYARSASDTEGKAEVTLSTCTDNASTTDKRLIVIGREI